MIGSPTRATALNIGSNAKPLSNNLAFLYVDAGAWPVDAAADVRALPFRDHQFTYVQCSHLIEHVPIADAVPALLEIRRVLDPCGVLFVSAPDMTRARAAGSREWIEYTKRGGWRDGWEHRWVCSLARLRKLLEEAGFVPSWAKATTPTPFMANSHAWPDAFEARFLCRRDDFPWPRSFPSGMEVIL